MPRCPRWKGRWAFILNRCRSPRKWFRAKLLPEGRSIEAHMSERAAKGQPLVMTDRERFRLRFGTYEPPPVDSGDWVKCRMRGMVEVGRYFSDGPIPWPRKW